MKSSHKLQTGIIGSVLLNLLISFIGFPFKAFAQTASVESMGKLTVENIAGAVPTPINTGNACAFAMIPKKLGTTTGAIDGVNITPLSECSIPYKVFVAIVPDGDGMRAVFQNLTLAGDGILKIPKLPPKTVQVSSRANGPVNGNFCSAVGVGKWTSTATNSALLAQASVVPPCGGQAGGLAEDPFTLPAGTYSYSPVIENILLSNTDENSQAILGFGAHSTLVTSEPLWELSLALTGDGTLAIGFQSASILNLVDTSVISDLVNALDTSTPGLVKFKTTTPYTLFNSSLTSTQPFIQSEFVKAGALTPSVPEPTSTLSLLAFGTLGAASTLKRKLKPSKPSEKETTKVS